MSLQIMPFFEVVTGFFVKFAVIIFDITHNQIPFPYHGYLQTFIFEVKVRVS